MSAPSEPREADTELLHSLEVRLPSDLDVTTGRMFNEQGLKVSG